MSEEIVETPESISIPTELVNAIAQYLSTKPYVEVASLIQGLGQAIEAQNEAKPLDKDK